MSPTVPPPRVEIHRSRLASFLPFDTCRESLGGGPCSPPHASTAIRLIVATIKLMAARAPGRCGPDSFPPKSAVILEGALPALPGIANALQAIRGRRAHASGDGAPTIALS